MSNKFGGIMKCFSPGQLPVLNALARSFAVCDSWFASMPGPTFPNRFFACAASSGGLDHSPTTAEILVWETIAGFQFPHGSIFDALGQKYGTGWRIYAGDSFPLATALKGIHHASVMSFSAFAATLPSAIIRGCILGSSQTMETLRAAPTRAETPNTRLTASPTARR